MLSHSTQTKFGPAKGKTAGVFSEVRASITDLFGKSGKMFWQRSEPAVASHRFNSIRLLASLAFPFVGIEIVFT